MMLPKLNIGIALALIGLGNSLTTRDASAVTAEVAKRCAALADMAYPLRVPGNPAAGRIHGTAQDLTGLFQEMRGKRGQYGTGPQSREPWRTVALPKKRDDKKFCVPQGLQSLPSPRLVATNAALCGRDS